MKLPVADARQVREHTRDLARTYRRPLVLVAVLHTLAALAGLVGPLILGRLVDAVVEGTTDAYVAKVIAIGLVAVVAQAVLMRFAQQRSMVFGETVFAAIRERFVETVTRLPLSTVERAGTGDLVARTTNDVDRIQHAVRFGVPRLIVAVVTVALTVVASLVVAPLVAVAMFVGLPIMLATVRWYLRRASAGYLREAAAYAELNGTITETVEGARTVDALGLSARREARIDADIHEAFLSERYTLNLRTVLNPGMDLSFVIAPIAVLVWGGWLISQGQVTLGAVTTVAMFTFQLMGPVWELIFWLDEIQVAATALARIVGVELVDDDRTATGERPDGDALEARGVRYAYREGHDVLHGIDLDLARGERLAVVGPSGAGKSTLGRMLAGIHPPTGGTVTVGGVPLVDLPLAELRGQVALVTQEHHVFVGSLAENLRLASVGASDDELRGALDAVDALGWAESLPEGLETAVGSGGHVLTPAQAQQVALARLVLLDPHTLVLDEATSLLDPRAARHLERSLNAVLEGRTVVAIAHRLHTAHDADRVAVVDAGRIAEIGPHDDLVAAGGDYARLWESWQQE
ncbi:ABC-type multidrug transport system fused ATPase/permease subunit [Sediminihabitans luteus]|uniref:ABC-type multidrug transport system fused ATPase/permease subunit n=1 Tax=Sediminihabitans luteus TaxID=1138585 RepID=A0A2M9CZL4_9CELL|nr:ABC transporter ATP-binding protein [Sediminihabitans luteus]PJJ77188.1 ABC-type multidrug transport system fused ATPase/permease subunit [Sediminihabitans luteus]GII98636.1 multidrug ABC transporter ATP-binding protein [Sediminihabitans luteus]